MIRKHLFFLLLFMFSSVAYGSGAALIETFGSNDYERFLRLYEASPDKSKVIDEDGLAYGLLSLSFYVEDPRFFERLIVEADPNAVSVGGYTALFEAATLCDLQRAERLVEHGANVDHVSEGGSTALYMAVLSSCYPVAEYLLAMGASPTASRVQGKLPLDSARILGDERMVRLLSQ